MPWIMAAMAAAQMLNQQKQEKESRQNRAVDQRYSHWLGGTPEKVSYADPAGIASNTWLGMRGQAQEDQNAAINNKLKEAQIEWLRNGNNPAAVSSTPVAGSSPSLGTYNYSQWLDPNAFKGY